MANENFDDDKELGKESEAKKKTVGQFNTPDSPTHSTRQIGFLVGLLWWCWIVACISDTLLSVDWAIVTYTRMTPLQHWIYYHRWDLWLYQVRSLYSTPPASSISC